MQRANRCMQSYFLRKVNAGSPTQNQYTTYVLHKPETLAFVDIETTGGNPQRGKIIEIAIIRTENGTVVEEWSSLVNPETIVPSVITNITGINNGDVEYAPTFSTVAPKILRLLDGAIVVAHNVRFDYSFIKNEFKRIDVPFSSKTLCTVKLSRALYPEHKKHGLQAIIDRFALETANRHRALDDTKAMFAFYNLAKAEHGNMFWQAQQTLMQQALLPIHITEQDILALPEQPGVYFFYDHSNTPMYIGKSANIRKQVLSHFGSDHATQKELHIMQQLQAIDYKETAGELGALLLETQLIKQHEPHFNRQQRRPHSQCAIELQTDKDGFLYPSYIPVHALDGERIAQCYGTFNTLKAAKSRLESIAEEAKLCKARLHLEPSIKRGKTCTEYQNSNCKGACIQQQSALEYNTALLQELQFLKHGDWPFESAIAIKEGEGSQSEAHIFYKWAFVGTLNEQSPTLESLRANFDIKLYTIVKRYLQGAHKKDSVHITPIAIESLMQYKS